MGYIRRPTYYKEFHCIASQCSDSCCWHWEIDIDEETLQYYEQVPGDFGKRLREHIRPANPKTGEPAHFIQDQRERCPFLNSSNLCDIFLELGEDHLSQICTHHPRFYEWFLQGQEAGLGLCCEEAARLILTPCKGPLLETIPTEDSQDSWEGMETDLALEEAVLSLREELFSLIRSQGEEDTVSDPRHLSDKKMDRLFVRSLTLDDELEDLFFPPWEGEENENEDEEEEGDEIGEGVGEDARETAANRKDADSLSSAAPAFHSFFWTEEFLIPLLSYYKGLEINDVGWWKLLGELSEALPGLLKKREAFLLFYEDHLYEYEQLLLYFLYRHFAKCREDALAAEKVHFALLSVGMLQLLDLYHWDQTGHLDLKEQVDLCKLYSKEIEYDEENTQRISDYLFQAESAILGKET